MADKTGIEWADATWNPVTGCAKVSQGCKHCYAEREWPRMTKLVPAYAGRDFTDVRTHGDRLAQPIRWAKRRMIFVNSMSDLFHSDVPDHFIDTVFAVMALCPQHTFQVLTKRSERMNAYLSKLMLRSELVGIEAEAIGGIDRHAEGLRQRWKLPLPNVWLGVSVEDQATADERIPLLLQTPAAVRWISAEPLLGPVRLSPICDAGSRPHPRGGGITCPQCGGSRMNGGCLGIDWVVVGGESGPKARPMHPEWARSLRDQCAASGVPFLFKQWGEWAPRSECYHTLTCGQAASDIDPSATKWPRIRLTAAGNNGRDLANACDGDDCYMQKVGKKLAGRLLDGVLHDAYPTPFDL